MDGNMTKLPEPTITDLKDYETFDRSPKYVVKYRETLMTEDPKNRIKKIKFYGYFSDEKKAKDHFFSLPTYYQWRRDRFAREFISVLSLKEFLQKKRGAKNENK
jgi:hypothetical protein